MVKRYDFAEDEGHLCTCCTVFSEEGPYVRYEDYDAMRKERDALRCLMQRAYDEREVCESMHWVHQAINHLDSWLDEVTQ